ncbi:MAG TPA: hypothetical protein EYQ50_10720 [Verrucomicrobiales bacterium]|jgi:hypothetical protein|nr:hypothetical protein [Verrucomicrobiales bacterium]
MKTAFFPLRRIVFSARTLIRPALILLFGLQLNLQGELIEMINGDRYQGKLVSVNRTTVYLNSDIQGDVKLPRSKVAAIYFNFNETLTITGAGVTKSLKTPGVKISPSKAVQIRSAAGSGVALKRSGAASETGKVLKQIQTKGINSELIQQVQKQFLGQGGPEAQANFNDMLQGLMDGSIDMNGLKVQARSAAQSIRSLKSELGDDVGPMFDGYLRILEAFLKEE